MLEQLMKEHGFKPYSGEWWHFSDTQSYPVEHDFEPGKK
jgi:D-alanyl-D-alanine dipeptidase